MSLPYEKNFDFDLAKDILIELRKQIDKAVESESFEVPELFQAVEKARRILCGSTPQSTECDTDDYALQAIEAMWSKGALQPVRIPEAPELEARLSNLQADMLSVYNFALAISRGDLSQSLKAKGAMAGGLKTLQSNLRHLTWQTRMIAQGDLSQRVDFLGDFSESFNEMVRNLAEARDQIRQRTDELTLVNSNLTAEIREREKAEEALRQARDELEIRVEERTAELSISNEYLKAEMAERQLAECALQESEKKFRTLVETMNEGLWVQDEQNLLTYVNGKLCELLGYLQEELLSRPAHSLFAGRAEHTFRENMSTGPDCRRASFETNLCARGGREIPVIVSSAPMLDSSGKFKGITATVTDYSALKQAQRARSHLAAIVESSDDAIIGQTPDGNIVSWNKAAERMYGYSAKEVVGRLTMTTVFPNESEDEEREILRGVLSGERKENYETVHQRKDAKRIHVSLTVSPIRDEHGKIIGISTISRDITARKQAEEDLRSYMARLEWANRELRDFAFVASHDLQEPLRKIQTFSDLVSSRYGESLDDRGRDYFERMKKTANRMQDLLRALMQYSRVTREEKPFSPVNLKELLTDVAAGFQKELLQSGGVLEIGDLPEIMADRDQMLELFQNLIGNALKFNDRQPRVRVYATECFEAQPANTFPRPYCRICVEDNGIGFNDEYLDKIFRPFQQLHGRNEYEGTGIGLTICRKIVERHGGFLTAESKPGEGSKFFIILPAKRP